LAQRFENFDEENYKKHSRKGEMMIAEQKQKSCNHNKCSKHRPQ
jgi:hypothetical protein